MEVTVQQAHGVPLAWSKIIQVVAATDGCRVLDIARALSITVGGASKVVDKVEAAGFPRVTADLATSASLVGLTLTTFFLGMALGQLLGGPLSDQRGRRIPMIVGGLTADGAVGDPDPMKAIEKTLAQRRFDELILSTLPPGISRWLAWDLPHRVRARTDVPLTVIASRSRAGERSRPRNAEGSTP